MQKWIMPTLFVTSNMTYFCSKKNKEMLSVILLAFLYLSAVAADLGSAFCPCDIYADEKGLTVADCQNQKLTTIPNCVPNSTYWLGFMFNDLRYTPGQFQKFGNLGVLSLFQNEKFAVHVDSFIFLPSLLELDLGRTDFTYLNGSTFIYQSNLRQLGLAGPNGHFNVSQELFDHLGNLEILTLAVKHTLVLPNWSFVKITSLLNLDLSFVDELHLNNYTFFGLSALKYLNIQEHLNTVFLPNELFKPLISLEELHLEGLCSARFPSFDCKAIDDRLQHVPSLKILYIDKTLTSHLGRGFLSLNNLEELYLVNSMAEQTCEAKLEPGTFKNLKESPLTKLAVSHCDIHFSLPRWFIYLSKLKEVSLSVTTWMYDPFWVGFSIGLDKTTITKVSLSITPNSIMDHPMPFTFIDSFNQTRLTSLEITDTRYYLLDDYMIPKLPKSLKYLNLTHNFIRYFGVKSLEYLENLETLDLSNQVDFQEQYPKISEFSYEFAPKKQHFSSIIRNEANSVRRMNRSRVNHNTVTRNKCPSLPYRLEYLDLSKSRLLCNMVPAFCHSNNSLKILNASEQRDRSCFKTRSFWSVLKNLAQLKELNLNGNFISEIPQGAFSGLYKLRVLTLFNNKLLELSFHVKYLKSLVALDVSANSIQYASISFTSQIEDVSEKTNLTLYLGRNPLVCNCKQLSFVAWLLVTQSILNKTKLNCTFENGTQVSLGQMANVHHILKYKCIMHDVTLGCSVTFWGLNLILGGLAYILHNRQKLRYLASFGRRTLNPYHPIEDHEIEMEYDVYISYEGDFYVTRDITLRDFVIYTILPGLERRGVKVIIREELDPGRNLYEVITQTVRRSKKVLAFLTNGYCSDMWNIFEFNQAVMEGIYTNRQVAIPVLFESLRHENVKEEICEFLKMEPVHKYSPELSDRAFIDFLYERIRDTRQFG